MGKAKRAAERAVEKPRGGKVKTPTFPPRQRLLEINETGHFTCYRKRTSSLAKNRHGRDCHLLAISVLPSVRRPARWKVLRERAPPRLRGTHRLPRPCPSAPARKAAHDPTRECR